MARVLLLIVLAFIVARVLWRVVIGVFEGMGYQKGPAAKGSVGLVRDPICGTFVVPGRAIAAIRDGRPLHFCSTRCRDAYMSRPESPEQSRA